VLFEKKKTSRYYFSRYPSVRTTRDNDRTYTQTNRHKKKEEKKMKEHEWMNEWMNEKKWMKQQTNQNNGRENTRTNIHTRTRAYTLKGYKPMMMIKTGETHIYIYQESDVVTGVDDANLCVLVGGCIRWSWTNCTRPHDDGACFVGTGDDGWTVKDDDDDGGGGGVDGITYDWWCEGKKGVVGERTNVDDDFV